MNYLSVAGLVSDLTGVMLLGADLVRVQRRLRSDAKDRIARLDEILNIGGIDAWAETVPSDFREWQWEEGRTISLPGTFDPGQAQASFEEVLGTVSNVGTHVVMLARMHPATIETIAQQQACHFAIAILAFLLIFVGFALQLPAYF